MSDRIPCEFFLIRYVPNVVAEEFVNIGVLLRQVAPESDESEAVAIRFTDDWGQVQRLHPEADLELLKSFAIEISSCLSKESSATGTGDNGSSILALMQDSFSNSIRLSGSQVSLAETFAGELDRLMQLYVEQSTPDLPGKTKPLSNLPN